MKISSKNAICFIVFAIFIFPPYLLSLGRVRTLYTLIAGVLSSYYILTFLINLKKRKGYNQAGNITYLLITLFYGIIVLSTIIHNGPLTLVTAQSFIAIGFMASIFCNFSRNGVIRTLSMLELWLGICCTINLITILVFPNGLYTIHGYNYSYTNPGYLLGHKNNAIEFLIPLLAITSYVDLLKGKLSSKRYLFYFAVSALTSVLTWSANEILCIFAILICNLYFERKEKDIFFNIRSLYIAAGVGTVALVGAGAVSYLLPYIYRIFNKSQTIMSRVRIWSQALYQISRSPIIGYGVEDQTIKYLKIGHLNSCHNYFLDFLYYGGVVLLLVVLLMLEINAKKTSRLQFEVKNKICTYFLGYFVLWLGSPIHRDFLFLMFGIFLISALIPWEQYDNIQRKKSSFLIRHR